MKILIWFSSIIVEYCGNGIIYGSVAADEQEEVVI